MAFNGLGWIAQGTNALATAYSNQRKLDYFQNGQKLTVYVDGSANAQFSYSPDGVTWTDTSSPVSSVANCSMFIDLDDYVHLVYQDTSANTNIYYRRGTPNVGRTSVSWSGTTLVHTQSGSQYHYPDVCAFRDPAGGGAYVAIIVHSYQPPSSHNAIQFGQANITSGGVVTYTDCSAGTTDYGLSVDTWPSVDFQHTGDGKTAVANPNVYAIWSAGATGAGKGIQARVIPYSGGAWYHSGAFMNGTDFTVDANHVMQSGAFSLTGAFDGTRFIAGGTLENAAGNNQDVMLYDAIDTTPVLHTIVANTGGTGGTFTGSLTYDHNQNIYLIGGDPNLGYYLWTRIGGAVSGSTTIDSNFNSGLNVWCTAKRNTGANAIEIIYTHGSASPFEIKYANLASFPTILGTNSSYVRTGYANQRRIDHFQNGKKVAAYVDSSNNAQFQYSTDGISWITMVGGSNIAGVDNFSMVIDPDDNFHLAYHQVSGGVGVNYMFGTPNAGRTVITWSTPLSIEPNGQYPDICAFRDPAGSGEWRAIVVSGQGAFISYDVMRITDISHITDIVSSNITSGASTPAESMACIDFQHNGDGKTPANSSPKLYAVWSAGNGVGVKAAVATYSGGVWTWGGLITLDTGHYTAASTGIFPLTGFFDGVRFVAAGTLYTGSTFDMLIYDAIDTTPVKYTLASDIRFTNITQGNINGTATYDVSGNVYLIGSDYPGNRGIACTIWTRRTAAVGSPVIFDAPWNHTVNNRCSTKRNIYGNSIEVIYSPGNAANYPMKFTQSLLPSFNSIVSIV